MRDNSSTTCYRADGTAQKRTHTPCDQASAYSMCCHNFAENGWSPDWCLPNGLCANNDQVAPEDEGRQGFWIESCTDPTWNDPACKDMKIFINSCYQDGAGNCELAYCPDTETYCCGRNKLLRDCCSSDYDERTVFSTSIPYARVVNMTTTISGEVVTTSVPTMVSAAATSTTLASPTTVSTSTGDSGLSAGAGAGIGVGAALGAVALPLLGFLLWRRSRRKRSEIHEAPPPERFEMESSPVQELSGRPQPHELGGKATPHQLAP